MKRKKPVEEEQINPNAYAYSFKDAGNLLGGISEPTVRALVERGDLVAIPVSLKRRVIPKKCIEEYVDRMIKSYQTR